MSEEDPSPFTVDPGIVVPHFAPAQEIPRFRDPRPLAVQVGDRSEKIDQLSIALAKVQARLKPAKRNSFNPFTKKNYADFASVIDAAQEAGLGEAGLSYVQGFEQGDPGFLTCWTMLILGAADQWITNRITIEVGSKGGASAAQEVVAASTYARRVGFTSIVGVVPGDDDDGNTQEQEQGKRAKTEPRRDPPRGYQPQARPAGAPPLTPPPSGTAVRPAPAPAAAPTVARSSVPANVVEAGGRVLKEEFQRQERVVHLMRELQPFGFRITNNATTGRVTFTFPKPFMFEGSPLVRFDQLTIEGMEALEMMLKDQLAARAAGGARPAPSAPSSVSNDRPTRSGREDREATEGSRGSRGEPLHPGPDDDVPF